MKCVLLALALVYAVQAIDVPQPMKDVDIKKILGNWHSMAMAANNIALLDSKDDPLKVFFKAIALTPEGNLEITITKWENDKCVEKKIVAEKTAVPAEFKIKYNDEELLFFLVNTDKSDEYPIVCIKSAQGAPQKKLVCQELAKTLTFNKEAMEKFSNFAKTADAQVILFFIPGQVDEPCRF